MPFPRTSHPPFCLCLHPSHSLPTAWARKRILHSRERGAGCSATLEPEADKRPVHSLSCQQASSPCFVLLRFSVRSFRTLTCSCPPVLPQSRLSFLNQCKTGRAGRLSITAPRTTFAENNARLKYRFIVASLKRSPSRGGNDAHPPATANPNTAVAITAGTHSTAVVYIGDALDSLSRLPSSPPWPSCTRLWGGAGIKPAEAKTEAQSPPAPAASQSLA